MDAKKFGAFISERRKEQHMTQAGLAGKIGVTDKAVSRWERGLGFPDINTMEPLATALGVSLLELMKSEIISEEVQMKKDESAEKKYTSAEVTEMMYSMEEIRKQQQRQDKIAGYLAILRSCKFWRCGVCRASGGWRHCLRILSLGESRR